MPKIITTKVFNRKIPIDKRSIDEEKRTIELSFSSEEPVQRYFGKEILGHEKKEVDLSFLGSGSAPFLVGHWSDDQVGVVESAKVADRKGRAVVRFGKSGRAEEIFADIVDGIRQNVSVGYAIQKMQLIEEDEDNGPTYRAVKWKPLEISLVAVPADETVGVGREARQYGTVETEIVNQDNEPQRGEAMPTPIETKDQNANPAPTPAVDVEAIKAKARNEEKARVADIMETGEAHNMRDAALKAVNEGKTAAEFQCEVLAELKKRNLEPVQQGADIGLTGKEARQFSFCRAINALANPTDRAAQEAAAFEYECSRTVADQLKRSARGIMVPLEVSRQNLIVNVNQLRQIARQYGMLLPAQWQRDMTVGTDAAGGYLVGTDHLAANFIEMLRNRMMTRNLGALVLSGLVGDVAIPKQTGGATAYWVAEGGDVTESTPATGQLALAPKTCGALSDISRKLLIQSSPDAEMLVRNDLSATLALALDAAGIAGTGASNQPTGILYTTGIGDVAGDTNGAAPDWADIVGLETEVSIDNADVGALAYLTNAKVRGKLKQTEKAANTAQFIWENGLEPGFGMLNGYRAAASNQVPSNLDKGTSTGVCSAIIFGNWGDLVYGLWGTVDITVDPYTQAPSGTVRVVALQDADVGVRHAESFSAMQDALTT